MLMEDYQIIEKIDDKMESLTAKARENIKSGDMKEFISSIEDIASFKQSSITMCSFLSNKGKCIDDVTDTHDEFMDMIIDDLERNILTFPIGKKHRMDK